MKMKYKNNSYKRMADGSWRIYSERGGSLFYVTNEKMIEILENEFVEVNVDN